MNELKIKVLEWLETPADKRDLQIGATLMVQANRNRILYQFVLKKENFEKIEYELNKFIQMNSETPITIEVIEEKEKQVEDISILKEADRNGKRSDHESLPPEIQKLHSNNMQLYPAMRKMHERLKFLNETGLPQDRLPFITDLLAMDAKLRENWDLYDCFDADVAIAAESKVMPTLTAKQVSAARKYLSDNKAKYLALVETGQTEKAQILKDKMQERYTAILETGETFAAEQTAELNKFGIA